jgi:hypothetical protein
MELAPAEAAEAVKGAAALPVPSTSACCESCRARRRSVDRAHWGSLGSFIVNVEAYKLEGLDYKTASMFSFFDKKQSEATNECQASHQKAANRRRRISPAV